MEGSCRENLQALRPQAIKAEAHARPLKPLRLRNFSSATEKYDTLHSSAPQEGPCGVRLCTSSLMSTPSSRQAALQPRSTDEILVLAKDFIDQYYASIKRLNTPSHHARWEVIQKEIHASGTYELTETELTFGAKLAWRNSARCIGRIQWAKLQVFDARHVTTTQGIFDALCNHIKYSTNKGNIRSAITVFPHRKNGRADFRVWNAQLVGYAGYRNPDGSVTGDPMNVEFTEVCEKFGWTGQRTHFDILPWILQAGNNLPDLFEIPRELILEIPLEHPNYDWFAKMDLRWYGLPAVSGMLFDCGGLEFTAAPFSGWYMVTEIATRDLGDPYRYNLLERVAQNMGLDTKTNSSLWKDRAVVELNAAVLYSYQKCNVTIVDHHTAADSFMKHYENEMVLRGGCPADWVWVVPPTSGSLTPVYHQEMATYALKPSYEYQDPAWKHYAWDRGNVLNSALGRRKYRFKEIARAVKFTSNLFGKALSRRIKATILYATETGKSEKFALMLADLFNHAFNAQVCCMADYDIANLEHEALVLVVASTFGNGEPPENGEVFSRELFSLQTGASWNKSETNGHQTIKARMSSRTLIKMSSITESKTKLGWGNAGRSISSETMTYDDNLGLLSNIRYAVFALGSSAYPNFCAFGKYVDSLLGELGGERLLTLTTGDELSGQEQAFKTWAQQAFHVACETFCLEEYVNIDDASKTALLRSDLITSDNVRFVTSETPDDVIQALSKLHGRCVFWCSVESNNIIARDNDSKTTIQVTLELCQKSEVMKIEPGDHIGIFPTNRSAITSGIMNYLTGYPDLKTPLELQVQTGEKREWNRQSRVPVSSLAKLLEQYLDVTTPPTQTFLATLAAHAQKEADKLRLNQLANDSTEYENWKHWKFPNLLEVFEEFPSVRIDAAVCVAQLPLLQPRFYSISASPAISNGNIDVTVAVIQYTTQNGSGSLHYGVCSNFLAQAGNGSRIPCFIRSAPNFHLPEDTSVPVIMVGPGTGIAPFRYFWQHKLALKDKGSYQGKLVLFSGSRNSATELYASEKRRMKERGILDETFLALSRDPAAHVQDKILEAASLVFKLLANESGHFYVCGDCAMAEGVANTLRIVAQVAGSMTEEEADNFLINIRDANRYHEDIFGITFRTPDIHNNVNGTGNK